MAFHINETSRVLNLLTSDSKLKRRESLEAIEVDCKTNVNTSQPSEVQSYCSFIVPYLSSSITDPVESHRERCLQILSDLCDSVACSDNFLPHIIQVLLKRLTQKETLEDSEEIRLKSLLLLQKILLKVSTDSTYTSDFCEILQHSVADKFPDIKILCCDILVNLASKFPTAFYKSAEPVLKPLLTNIIHQQHRVRHATVNAIGVVFKNCDGKFVDYTVAPLTQRLFDLTIPVRMAVIHVVGDWLLNLMDRYSYHSKLIPLMLSGLIDESKEIREEALEIWSDVGLKYQNENEDQLKDKIDFDPGPPSYYPIDQARPNFGCRELVNRTASRMLPGLCRDLSDWQEATRRKAAGLLPIILLHLESAVTQHTQLLISGFSTGIGDAILRTVSANSGGSSIFLILMNPERGLPSLSHLINYQLSTGNARDGAPSSEVSEALQVIHQLYTASRYTSCFVSIKIWWKLALESCKRCNETTSPTGLAGNIFLIANLISGSSLDELVSFGDDNPSQCFALRIAGYLTSADLLSCSAFASKAALLECVNSLSSVVSELTSRWASERSTFSGTTSSLNVAICGDWDQICLKLIDELFFLLMALSSQWKTDCEKTEFAAAFNDEVGRLLCSLSRSLQLLSDANSATRTCVCTAVDPITPEAKENELIAKAKRGGQVLENLYSRQLPLLLKRLDRDRVESGGWHPYSIGLSIFSHAVLSSGPALISGLEPPCKCCKSTSNNASQNCLLPTLKLLEEGCQLAQPLQTKGESDKDSLHPMTISAEAELHLRGLLLLVRLTEHARVRIILSQPKLFRYCLQSLVLPSCVWRSGRTAEAMRKAAVTSLVALLAAVVPLSPPSRRPFDSAASLNETMNTEQKLDEWLDSRILPTLNQITELLGRNGLLSRRICLVEISSADQLPNLGLVSSASPKLLSLLLSRLGGMLTDDLEATRLLACTGLVLFFGGIFSGGGEHIATFLSSLKEEKKDSTRPEGPKIFIRSPAWFLPLAKDEDKQEVDIAVFSDKMPGLNSPLPGSIGDQVYRFYPCLSKALDDVSDEVRLRVADILVTWFWVVSPNLISAPPPVPLSDSEPILPKCEWNKMNPVYSAVIEDLIAKVVIHLDDSNALIRVAVARVILRFSRIASETVRKVLQCAKERHRSPQLCESLLESLEWNLDDINSSSS